MCNILCCTRFCISKCNTRHCKVSWKYSLCHSLFITFLGLCIHWGSGNDPMWYQYIILDFHGVTNTCGLCYLHFQPHRFQGCQLNYFHIQTTILWVVCKIIGGEGSTGRSYLGELLFVEEHSPTVSHTFYVSFPLHYFFYLMVQGVFSQTLTLFV